MGFLSFEGKLDQLTSLCKEASCNFDGVCFESEDHFAECISFPGLPVTDRVTETTETYLGAVLENRNSRSRCRHVLFLLGVFSHAWLCSNFLFF